MFQVRKASESDAETITTCLLLAMTDIIYGFIGEKNPEKARAFMLHFVSGDNNQYSYQNCWVVEDDMEVAGAILVYDGARLHELRRPVADYINTRFMKDFHPEDETHPGEYYIDTLGVNPDKQNKGIGTHLLQFVIDEYVSRRNLTLGLLVDDDNPGAKRLYLKSGFKSAGKRILFGKNMEHLQIKG